GRRSPNVDEVDTSFNVDEVDDEDQRLPRRDRPAGTSIPVGQVRRYHQPATPTHPHTGDPVVPALDHAAATKGERQRVAAAPRTVELLPRGEGDADVVSGDSAA